MWRTFVVSCECIFTCAHYRQYYIPWGYEMPFWISSMHNHSHISISKWISVLLLIYRIYILHYSHIPWLMSGSFKILECLELNARWNHGLVVDVVNVKGFQSTLRTALCFGLTWTYSFSSFIIFYSHTLCCLYIL